jgi:hypothetical protein
MIAYMIVFQGAHFPIILYHSVCVGIYKCQLHCTLATMILYSSVPLIDEQEGHRDVTV